MCVAGALSSSRALNQVLVRSAISTIYEPSIKSIVMDSAKARKKEQIGSFAGLQQTMKGLAQVRAT